MHPMTLRKGMADANQALFDAYAVLSAPVKCSWSNGRSRACCSCRYLDFPKPLFAAVNGPAIGTRRCATVCAHRSAVDRGAASCVRGAYVCAYVRVSVFAGLGKDLSHVDLSSRVQSAFQCVRVSAFALGRGECGLKYWAARDRCIAVSTFRRIVGTQVRRSHLHRSPMASSPVIVPRSLRPSRSCASHPRAARASGSMSSWARRMPTACS